MRKLNLLITIFLLGFINTYAQSWSEIKNNPLYYWGEGVGKTIQEADQNALSFLITQISTNITIDVDQTNNRVEQNGKLVSDNTIFKATFNTFSQATLTNTERIIVEPEPNARVGRYMKRSEFGKILEARRSKIRDLIEDAQEAESKGKIDVALKNYYWAMIFVRSMQNPNEEKLGDEVLITYIPKTIESILSDVNIRAIRRSGDNVELEFKYKGRPVNSIDYFYIDGGFESNQCSAKNGLGLIELLPGNPHNQYQIEIEYEYSGLMAYDPELVSINSQVTKARFKDSFRQIMGLSDGACLSEHTETQNKIATDTEIKKEGNIELETSFTTVSEEVFKLPKTIKNDSIYFILNDITSCIRNNDYSACKQYFTPNGLGIFTRLVKYGNAKVVGTPEFSLMTLDNHIIGRGLSLAFAFRNGTRKNFVEDIVFTFNSDNLIDNVCFGLGKTTENDILGNNSYPEKTRKLIAQFLENYQTAYALKRLDYITTLFDDNAIIISGQILKQAPKSKEFSSLNNDSIIIYNREDKDSYLKRLNRQFNSKEYINLKFSSIQLSKSYAGKEIYGIQIEQDYYSSNYSDHGYLFLELNMQNPNKPLIIVRTWQPNVVSIDERYNLSNFPIYHFDAKH